MTRPHLRFPLRGVLALALAMPALHALAADDLCTRGRRQSPIDIEQAAPDARLPALAVHYRSAPLVVVHDGHTVRVRIPGGSHLQAGREAWALTQFHFHLPGGDRIRGEDFPMALHLLHRDPSGQLVSVVAPFRLGAAHAGLRALLPHMPQAGTPEQRPAGAVVDATDFMPRDTGYYRYDGSLTAPPCTEGVRWIVLRQAQTLSAEQLHELQRLIQRNARPVQPLNGRLVQASP